MKKNTDDEPAVKGVHRGVSDAGGEFACVREDVHTRGARVQQQQKPACGGGRWWWRLTMVVDAGSWWWLIMGVVDNGGG